MSNGDCVDCFQAEVQGLVGGKKLLGAKVQSVVSLISA